MFFRVGNILIFGFFRRITFSEKGRKAGKATLRRNRQAAVASGHRDTVVGNDRRKGAVVKVCRKELRPKGGRLIAEITDKKVNVKNVRVFCGDKNADFITFSVPKEYNGVSLENVPVYIKVKNQLGECRKKVLSSGGTCSLGRIF